MNELVRDKYENPKYRPFQTCNEKGFFNGISIKKTPYKNEESENSLMFDGEPETAIRNAFKITDSFFSQSFREACSGDGMEKKRIATLHSSSLLSLLFFHTVNNENAIQIDCGKGTKGCFTGKKFEHQNEIKPGHCSNIDVKLNDNKNKITLFLESKYSEYLSNGKYSGISNEVYLDYYKDILQILEKIGLTIRQKDDQSFDLCARKGYTKHYAGGIKQMISHWIGAISYAHLHEDETVRLGEIVYDFGNEQSKSLERYENDYAILAGGLNNSRFTPKNLLVLPQLMTYQSLYIANPGYKILSRIEEYYDFKR